MNSEIADRVTRIKIYLERVRRDVQAKDLAQAVADSAELNFHTRELWNAFDRLAKATPSVQSPVPIPFQQVFDSMQCHSCQSQPALISEVLDSDPAIVTWRFECACGTRTNQFYEIGEARKSWLELHTKAAVGL